MLSAAPLSKERRGFRAAGLAIPWPRSLRLGSASGSNVRGCPAAVNGRGADIPHLPRKPSGESDPLDRVGEVQEALAGEREAVVRPQLAVLDEDVDLLL